MGNIKKPVKCKAFPKKEVKLIRYYYTEFTFYIYILIYIQHQDFYTSWNF